MSAILREDFPALFTSMWGRSNRWFGRKTLPMIYHLQKYRCKWASLGPVIFSKITSSRICILKKSGYSRALVEPPHSISIPPPQPPQKSTPGVKASQGFSHAPVPQSPVGVRACNARCDQSCQHKWHRETPGSAPRRESVLGGEHGI